MARDTAKWQPGSQPQGFSLAELILAVTACAAWGAIVANSIARGDELSPEVAVPIVFFSGLTGVVVGVTMAMRQPMRLRGVLLAGMVGLTSAAMAGHAIALELSVYHVIAGAGVVCGVAMILRLAMNRHHGSS